MTMLIFENLKKFLTKS